MLAGVPECPHVWCDFTLLCNPHLTERIKFNVLEIQENFDNYVDKKETTVSCLEGLKAHSKLLSLGDLAEAAGGLEADQVELCRFLYKLHFQQLLLLESYTKLLQLLSGAASGSGVADLSAEVARARSCLLAALSSTLTPPGSPKASCSPRVGSPEGSGEGSPGLREREVEGATGDSPTPVGSSPASGAASPRGDSPTPRATTPASPTTPSSPGDPTPTAGSEGEEGSPPRTPSPIKLEAVEVVVEEVELAESVEVVETVETMPETAEEAEAMVVERVAAGRWKAVWGVWRGTRGLRGALEEGLSPAERDLADLTTVLDTYCRHLAQSREGEFHSASKSAFSIPPLIPESSPGIFVMTVSAGELGQVCSSLMDISLQLLASVKKLEQSLTQVGAVCGGWAGLTGNITSRFPFLFLK